MGAGVLRRARKGWGQVLLWVARGVVGANERGWGVGRAKASPRGRDVMLDRVGARGREGLVAEGVGASVGRVSCAYVLRWWLFVCGIAISYLCPSDSRCCETEK